jgi:hypothetical protein
MHHSSLLQALLAGLLCAQLASAGREPPAFIPLSNRNSKVAKDAQPLVPAQDLTPEYDTCCERTQPPAPISVPGDRKALGHLP